MEARAAFVFRHQKTEASEHQAIAVSESPGYPWPPWDFDLQPLLTAALARGLEFRPYPPTRVLRFGRLWSVRLRRTVIFPRERQRDQGHCQVAQSR